MAELEQDGYLTHPHTSAGRVPTDKAYRFYVDSLVDLQRLAIIEEERIHKEYEARVRELEELMLTTSKTLSILSRYSGFVTAPTMDAVRLRHVELIPLDGPQVLVVLVADTGLVKHRVVAFHRAYPRELLTTLSRLLNETLRGQPFSEVRERILDHIEAMGQRQLDLLALAKDVTRQVFQPDAQGDIYLEGTSNILSLPDFRDFDQVRTLAHLMDEKRMIGEVLSKDLAEGDAQGRWPDIQVKIGSETRIDALKDLSLVSATYTIRDRKVGVLGIIGPKRMEYSRMMSLVATVAKSVSRVLGKLAGG
jgi:heat-inducible transcriptional repressor